MDAGQLGRWTRFAAKGGIGKCTAIQDCVAERPEDLMFMQDDEITVLMQVPGQVDLYLGYCEGVVGHFRGDAVRFHSRLKKPVLTKRQSTASPLPISRPGSSQSALTVFARDVASPAVSIVRDPPSPVVTSRRELSSPTISITREPELFSPPIAPSVSSSSSISITTFSHAPSPQPDRSSGHPERSMSHESQATSLSSMPETPADGSHDEASIASDREDDRLDTTHLAPPIRLDQFTKQLSTDSPIEHPQLPDPTTSRFPPVDRDSSIYSDDQSNHRLSVVSDNGVGNIGLSLLQDFGGGSDDSDSEDGDSPSIPIPRVQSPESAIDEALDYADSMRSDSQYSESPRSTTLVLPSANAPEPPLTGRSEFSQHSASHYSVSPPASATYPPPGPIPPLEPLSPRSPTSFRSLGLARSESEYGSEGEGDWEGADDIYDQYRYSRFSMASKMSRFSKGSIYTIGSGSDAPPMPNQRTSLESTSSGRERKESKGKLPSRLAESTTLADVGEDAKEPSRMEKNRPAPLTFRKEPEPSPLLHTTFGSPQASPTLPSATSGTFGSPTLVSPVYPSNTAAAMNTKRRTIEGGDPAERGSHHHLSVEEHEGMPMTAKSQVGEIVDVHPAARQSPPPTPAIPSSVSQASESSAAREKRMLALSNADDSSTEGPPPPPYSPTASDASSPASIPTPGPSTSPMPLPATSSPPQSVVIPPPSHPQARIRDPNRPAPHPLMRQSLFMPHPGAPKPAPSTAGPMYGRPQQMQQSLPPPQHMGPPPGSIHYFLAMAFAARREGRPAPPTVYGRFEYDLTTSFGPVPITFSHEPQNNVPANRAARPPMPWTPSRTGSPASQLAIDLAGRRSADPTRRSATSPPALPPSQMLNAPGSSPPSQLAIDLAGRRSADPTGRRSATSPPIPPPDHIEQMLSAIGPIPGPVPTSGGGSAPIQRTNFTPTIHKSRPRSRSFSVLTSGMDLSIKTQVLNEGSRDDSAAMSASPLSPPMSPIRPLQITTKRSKSAMATTTTVANVPAPQRATVSHSSTVLRGLHAPSPLSQSQNNTVAAGPSAVVAPPVRSPPLRASTNPLPASSPPADPVSPAQQQILRTLSLDERPSLESNGPPSPRLAINGIGQGSPEPQLQSPLETLPETVALNASPPSSPRSAINFPPPGSPRVLRHSRSAMLPTSTRTSFSNHMSSPTRTRIASQGLSDPRLSVDTFRSEASSPSVVSRMEEASDGGSVIGLHVNKRSNGRPQMTPLRLMPSSDQGTQSHQSIKSPTVSVSTATSEYTIEQDTVQVQDTDFELIKPTLPMSPLGGSFESLPSPSPASSRPAPSLLRTGSPAFSELSGHSQGLAQPGSVSPSETRSLKESEASASQIEAHRQRELRWISTLSSISLSPSQARKSKKIRKMVLDGVPASVRYQVWAALADSKGKRMEGLYQRLAQREKVAAYPEIERDIQASFTAHPQLQDGSLAKLLQAYLCMVPDIQYSRGLSLIAGQLLLQSPEEDAFWTFISLMDSHLRPYFSKSSVLLEVDASLFAKALESNDAPSAKKLFGNMAISPVVVCRAWFTTVFGDAVPPDYLVRLWDVFLFEGVTFLFRAGLALFACTRRVILQSPSPEAVLQVLAHPPPTCLPPSPDAFVELAFSMKFKDDDVRKQRSKLEAQVKRRTAQARAAPISSATTSAISLPKNGI